MPMDWRDNNTNEKIIGQEKAERYAKMLRESLRGSVEEEDVRVAMYNFLVTLSMELGVHVKIRNERIVLSGGRIDSLFENIILEFKKPGYFKSETGQTEAVEGRKIKGERKGGIIEYLLSLALEDSHNLEDFISRLSSKMGVGFDSEKFIFVRYVSSEGNEYPLYRFKERLKSGKKTIPKWLPDYLDGVFSMEFQPEMKAGLRLIYLTIRTMSPRDPLKPINVSKRFGEKSPNFSKHMTILYGLLWNSLQEAEPHVATLYDEWNRVFGKVYGGAEEATREVRDQLYDTYKGIIDFDAYGGLDLQRLIFSIHTYYNIILKFLVSELLSSLLNPFSKRSTLLALTDDKFRQRVIETMTGEYFKVIGIVNFFEIGFFEWWSHVWNSDVSMLLREIVNLLEELEVATSIIKPELIGDTVKETYHSLMPQLLRHFLGEYFTPDWLAEYSVNLSGFEGRLTETFLDPACGSGTFLAYAIKKKQRTNQNENKSILIRDILKTVVGFDLNPISVIASKTNYLLSLGDLSNLDFPVKIPVFQCDSILTPSVHAKQKEGERVFTIDTIVGNFRVPAFTSREEVEELLDAIKISIDNGFTVEEFHMKLKNLNIKGEKEVISDLFQQILALSKARKDGFWTSILKNAFAPVYSSHQFDVVVGNPPWVSWKSMSKSYRDLTLPIWLSYDIFNKSAYDKVTTHDDFAMAFTYVSIDHYLKSNGNLCFVISQAFFKSRKGGEGFRKFEITRDGLNIPIKVNKVVDMVAVKPFKEVTNRTSVVLLHKGEKTKYPVPYAIWKPKEKVKDTDGLSLVMKKINELQYIARPIGLYSNEQGIRTPWLTLPEGYDLGGIGFIGKSDYRGRKGVEPLGAKGVYVLLEPEEVAGNHLRIKNDLSRGRLREIEESGQKEDLIEDTFVYPMISGRNIDRWGVNSFSYVLLPHKNRRGPHNGVPESEMKVNWTNTFQWLTKWKKILLETRKRNSKYYEESKDPFYILDNVGTYTFSPYKVVWREQNREMVACVISKKRSAPLANKLIIPDSKVLFCPLESEDEAHYLCAILNSKVVTDIIEGYTIETQRGIDILDNIAVPKYDAKNQKAVDLAMLSKQAHDAYAKGNDTDAIQEEINALTEKFLTKSKKTTLKNY